MADVKATAPRVKPYIESDRNETIRIIVVGALAGIVVPLLGVIITNLVIKPLFCHSGETGGICLDNGAVTGYHTAAILIGLGVVALFANWGVFRPLPLVIAVTIALWGVQRYLGVISTHSWFEFYFYSILLSALCYLLFFWLLRLRNLPVSLITSGIIAILIYWVFTR